MDNFKELKRCNRYKSRDGEIIFDNCPSFYNEDSPSPLRTNKFKLISSIKIIELLKEQGLFVYEYGQRGFNARGGGIKRYTKHYAWLGTKESDEKLINNEVSPQYLFLNAHDGTTTIKFYRCLRRKVCDNGLIISNMNNSISFKHFENPTKDIFEKLKDYSHNFEEVISNVESMKLIELTQKEIEQFTNYAKKIRFGGTIVCKIENYEILKSRRKEDEGNSLWKIYNRVQENLIKGGLIMKSSPKMNGEERIIKTHPIYDVNAEIRINLLLWENAKSRINSGKFITI